MAHWLVAAIGFVALAATENITRSSALTWFVAVLFFVLWVIVKIEVEVRAERPRPEAEWENLQRDLNLQRDQSDWACWECEPIERLTEAAKALDEGYTARVAAAEAEAAAAAEREKAEQPRIDALTRAV